MSPLPWVSECQWGQVGRSGPVRTEQEGALAAVPSTGRASEVERSAAPEADAARALYDRHAGQIYSFCLHRLGSREEAEDAVQTTFLNAFRGLRRGVVPEAETAWLFKIAENVCLTRRRSAWRRGRVESPSDLQAFQDVTPAREGDSGDQLIPLGDALAAMPEAQRRAILLREWQGLSYKEIAAEMAVSASAVETLIFRARRSLANALETPWQDRRATAKTGRRAFDLGSLLAGLKTLFAGGTAAKVAVVAVAATGTAALAVAEAEHKPRPQHVEAQVPDSVSGKPRARVAAPAAVELGLPHSVPPKSGAGPSGSAVPRKAGKTGSAADGETEKTKTPPGQAKEPGTPATGHGRSSQAKSKAKTKPKKPKPHAKAKPKTTPTAKPKSRPPSRPNPPANGQAKPGHASQSPPRTRPDPPKPEQAKPQAATPSPPPPPPPPPAPEKQKGKDGGE